MEGNYPTIHEFYRDGDSKGNRKIFVRIRIPRGMTRDYRVVLHSLTTQRSQQGGGAASEGTSADNTASEFVEGAPVDILPLPKGTTEKYVLLIADETGDWSTQVEVGGGSMNNLIFATTPEQRVIPVEAIAPGERNPLIQLVNPTTQITTNIREKLDASMNGDDTVSFTPAEKKAIAYNPSVTIVQAGDYGLFRSAETKKREGLTLTPEEEEVWQQVGGNAQQAESKLGRDVVMDALRIMHAGPVWLVRQKRECAGPKGIPLLGAEWCKNTTANTTTVYKDNIPYETIVPMKGEYPGECNRSHFDYDQGVCRMTAGGDFMLMGFDDGISVPILYDCLAEDLTQNEGETKDQFRARKNGTALSRGMNECKNRIPTFDTKSGAVRHCETVGCTTIVHDELGKILTKPWAATMGSTQMITKPGVSTTMASSIDRTELGVIPVPLCRFCDVPGTPTTFGQIQRDNCCRCGGGEFRRFFSVPIRNLINPIEPYEKPKHAIEIINTGSNYSVGDHLRVTSTAVPYAKGALVRVTRIHDPPRNSTPRKEGMTCDATCESFTTRCMNDDGCGDNVDTCECAQPGDSRMKSGIQTVVVVEPGEDYESGAPLYRLVGGSGSDATLRIYSVDIRGGITYSPPSAVSAGALGATMAASIAAIGVAVFGGLFYRGYKKSAWTTLSTSVVVALLVGLLVKTGTPPPTNAPGTRKKVKALSVCADGEELNQVTGACEDEAIALTRLRKITDHY